MKFKMNNVEYTIKEVSQQEFWDYQVDEQVIKHLPKYCIDEYLKESGE